MIHAEVPMPKKSSANVPAKKAKATNTVLIGYSLYGHDNDSNMLGEETRKAANREDRSGAVFTIVLPRARK